MPELKTNEQEAKAQEWLTPEELADTLRVETSWVYRQTMRKDADAMPRLKCGKYLRFRLDAVIGWLESQQD